MAKVGVVVPAAGQGTRMNADKRKQYLDMDGIPVLGHVVKTLADSTTVDNLVLVCLPGEEDYCRSVIIEPLGVKKTINIVPGGNERQESVYNGLLALSDDTEIAVVHDGARPLLKAAELDLVVEAALKYRAATLAVPVKDTVKQADEFGFVKSTLARERLWLTQTPQAFSYALILEAHQQAILTGFKGTDDASLVEALGKPVRIVLGSYKNIKITTPDDLLLAAVLVDRNIESKIGN
ncbi:MAG: 2-C-methyl-D-erythritol 4-phosphate cytidylyltransferase [Peptococcaceae bacterium]|nr:2-C-methyl-D-erythritol 4-phosphate cytidylyltransferase [Peptococcaceae bacterium]